MILIYLYILGLPARVRLIFGVLVGGAFFVLLFSIIWFNVFADTLVKFVPADSDYYIHISKTDSNRVLDGTIEKIFADRNLSFLKLNEIKRGLSVFGRLDNCQGLIFKVWNINSVKSKLDNYKAGYFSPGHDVIIITNCENTTSNGNGKLLSEVKKTYFPNSLGIYLSKDTIASNPVFQSICMVQKNKGSCFISGEFSSDRIKLFTGREQKTLSRDVPVKINGQEFDFASGGKSLVGFISNFFKFEPSSSTVNNLAYLPSALGAQKINSSLLLMNEKNSSSPYLWKKFELYWEFNLNQPLSGDDLSKLEDALRSEAAQEFPSQVITQLTDGTKITEFVAKASKFTFIEGVGYKYFDYPDNSASIYYKISSSSLMVTNKKDLLNSKMSSSGDNNFVAIKSNILPETELFSYVKLFTYICADENSIYLK